MILITGAPAGGFLPMNMMTLFIFRRLFSLTRSLWRYSPALAAALFVTGCASVRDNSRTFRTVVIDAGHGGHDVGALGVVQGLREKDVALDVSQRLAQKLRVAGFETVMTRDRDQFISLDKRIAISNQHRNAIFVSVHFNHARSRSAVGIETFYKHPHARGIAQRVNAGVTSLPGNRSRGVKTANFRVLRLAKNPAVLVECGFLSNRSDAGRANSTAYRDDVAETIVEALLDQRYGENSREKARYFARREGSNPSRALVWNQRRNSPPGG